MCACMHVCFVVYSVVHTYIHTIHICMSTCWSVCAHVNLYTFMHTIVKNNKCSIIQWINCDNTFYSLTAHTPTGCIWVGTKSGNAIVMAIDVTPPATMDQPRTVKLMPSGNVIFHVLHECLHVHTYSKE